MNTTPMSVVSMPFASPAAIIAPELLSFEEHHVDVDISGGVSMGNTFADLMNVSKKSSNMKVALDVRGRDFIELFIERMESLSLSIQDQK